MCDGTAPEEGGLNLVITLTFYHGKGPYDELQENLFQSGLREVIGSMKRSGDKNELRKYVTENEERFRNMEEDTYDTLSIMVNQKDLQSYKQKCRNQEGGYDMCKAIQDIREEGKIEGNSEGMRTKAEVVARNMFLRGTSIEDTAAICEEEASLIAGWFETWKSSDQ